MKSTKSVILRALNREALGDLGGSRGLTPEGLVPMPHKSTPPIRTCTDCGSQVGRGSTRCRSCANSLKRQSPTAIERFWSSVDRADGDDSCWIWTGNGTKDGYGRLSVDGRKTRAHRFSYELHNGPIPDGLLVCHHCDVPLCCNPKHMFLGTTKDNVQDMLAKGRVRPLRGTASPNARLNEDQVREIRARYAAGGVFQKDLASAYGVAVKTISHIVCGDRWKHVSEEAA